MIRLFAALDLPDEAAEALAPFQCGLAEADWRPREALHITLKFAGDLREDLADDLGAELSRIGGAPLILELAGAGAFGEGRDIHAVWARVTPTPALTRLARACEIAARRAGLEADARAYTPHVTLAYLTRPAPETVASWLTFAEALRVPAFRVDRFGLYSSWRGPDGSRYRLERSYPLDRRADPA
ncbi:MAG: RNA 2',3'-cyclic phosphodiesterase [Phenylobacterium sp.]|nr:RNA 2',3'-cyclic phosphodiesterase [Phenylobacterium sp.]